MKWLGIVAGGLLALIFGVAAAGWLLPEDHVATRAAHYHQPPEMLWQTITGYANFPAWRSNVKSVEPLPQVNGMAAWREVDRHGNVLPLQVEESMPPARLVGRIADPHLPFGGTWTYEIQAEPRGAMLRITERGQIHNPIFRFMARFVTGYSSTMERT